MLLSLQLLKPIRKLKQDFSEARQEVFDLESWVLIKDHVRDSLNIWVVLYFDSARGKVTNLALESNDLWVLFKEDFNERFFLIETKLMLHSRHCFKEVSLQQLLVQVR
jgi:hypothetical protein